MKIENMLKRFSCTSFLFKPPWKKQVLPEKIKKDVAHFARKYGIPEARKYSSSKISAL